MALFDQVERTETRARRERESTFAYLNSSAREPVAAARQVLQEWFTSYPESGKTDLLARFRSPTDAQHKSAFWELYLYELFSRLGFTLDPHPNLSGSPNHPDFLVKEGDEPKFYLEAVVAGLPSPKDAGAEARLAEVFDLVNKMQISDWFLHIEHRGMPDTPPSVKELRKQLDTWLASLNVDDIGATLKAEEWDSLPRFEWQHEGLTLFVTPSPRSQDTATRPDTRPIGIVMGEAHQIETDEDIRRALESKAKKYGTLPLPLVVATNVVSDHCDDLDINNALFGNETVLLVSNNGKHQAASGRRLPNGVWFGTKGVRNQTVSAVLVGNKIDIYSAADATPLLIQNPYPTHRLSLTSYPLPESVPDTNTGMMNRKQGAEAKEYLRLPTPWPPAWK